MQEPAPTEVGASNSLQQIFKSATIIQKNQGDSHLAVDHLLLALAEDKVSRTWVLEEKKKKKKNSRKRMEGSWKLRANCIGTCCLLICKQDIMKVLGEAGGRKDQLVDTIKHLRHGHKVEGKSAEEAYDALNKYGHDLVADAESGMKLEIYI